METNIKLLTKTNSTTPLHVVMVSCAMCACSMVAHAQDYSQSQVTAMAHNYFAADAAIVTMANSITIDTLYLGSTPKMFLCQDGNNWVVLANEQSVSPVVCLGEGTLSVADLQNSPLWLLLNESMLGLDSLRRSDDYEPTEKEVSVLSNARAAKMTPLLELDANNINRWGQSYNNDGSSWANANYAYNKFCPDFYNVAQGRTVVGCTAVAMAQVMWYNKWPNSATIPSNINVAGITSGADITRTYNWSNMPGSIYNSTPLEKVNAVAGLMRDCGYAGHMIYAKGGSSMTLTNAISALRNTFQYSAHMKQYSAGAKKFNNLIKSEIAAKRPVIIQATHESDGSAHSFVIDGYDSATEMFHINLGWRGAGKGEHAGNGNTWYSVSGADCYAHYTVARRMLYEIIPNRSKQIVMDYEDEIEESAEQTQPQKNSSIIIQVTPNNIHLNSNSNVHWIIYDLYGNSVLNGSANHIDVSNLTNGTYTIIVSDEISTNQKTFIKR